MNTIVYTSKSVGAANHGWLQSRHYFSFADYYDPERIHFGMLRVLNDDIVAPESGFCMHPHDNMEIITIPLLGSLWHKDNMGNQSTIQNGEIQVMSAGTGIMHSEWNKDSSQPVQLFQIWIYPRNRNVTPRYQQIEIASLHVANELYQILSPNQHDSGVWIHQNAWMYMGNFDKDTTKTYTLHTEKNGVFILVIDGNITIAENELHTRDAIGIWNIKEIAIQIQSNTKLLIIEVPMN